MLRRVSLEKAEVVYSDQVPTQQRDRVPANALAAGAEVRVIAEQDEAGEWRALRIEILKVAVSAAAARLRAV
jgi:hypothetical protein